MSSVILIVVSGLLVTVILLQQKSSSLGSMMGGDGGDEMVKTRRGFEIYLHQATVCLALTFAGLGLYHMLGL